MVLIDRALCLPAVDIAALLSGQSIAAISNVFIQTGWSFALYPYFDTRRSYRLQPQLIRSNALQAWAKCEHCIVIEDASQIEALSRLTIWTKDTLKDHLEQKQRLILTFLRVCILPEPIEINAEVTPDKFGKFISLSTSDERFKVLQKITKNLPVLDDRIFTQRKHQLENLEPPEHPELEALHSAIAQLTDPSAIHLTQDLECFLGWAENSDIARPDPDLSWISTIAQVGNSSDGDRFEKLVRRSFIKLGFSNSLNNCKASLDPEASGGAGGIDIYCEAPYALVGECKASKNENVPNSVSAQLVHLGTTHLGRSQFEQSIKVLFVAGRLTDHAEKAAVQNLMNVMRPETLQRLVTLKTKHPGAIDLLNLKACLEVPPFGEASDMKVNEYVDQCWQKINLRSHIIEQVKLYLENAKLDAADIAALHAVYTFSKPPQPLSSEELHHILIELASPLTEGYLGRIKGSDWKSDRFYFLRPLMLGT